MSKGLLIIDRTQFGYLTDSFKWSEYACENMPVRYVCFDYGKPKFEIEGVNVSYVARKGLKPLRAFKLIFRAIVCSLFHRGPIIVISFPRCELIKRCLPWKKMNLDIRTMSINPDSAIRKAMNSELLRQSKFFDTTSVISNDVAKAIGIDNAMILPLGADVISASKKEYVSSIRLIYIGTLSGRRIEDTIMGVRLFMNEHPEVPITYDIFGGGEKNEVESVVDAVQQAKTASIRYHGRKSHDELKEIMDNSNVGLSFVPVTDYYDLQPPTKTYEYAMSGIYTIGTCTKANEEIINDDNGILIRDTPQDVAVGLWRYWQKRHSVVETDIRNSLSDCTWGKICKTEFTQLIDVMM